MSISSTRIAHVLFIDIVGYSRDTTAEQARRIERLNQAVNDAEVYKAAVAAGAVQHLHTGDGMALVFFNDVLAPVQAALQIAKDLGGGLPLRMGIHSGLVLPQMDAAGRDNLVGEGLNTAQRVMDFGDAGHILLSAQYAAWLQQFDDWGRMVHPLGDGVAKHNLVVSLYSLHGDGFGLATLPEKMKSATQPKSVGKKVALLYRPNIEPDGNVLLTLESRLKSLGHEVFVDSQRKISAAWAKAIEDPIRQADAVVAIVSPESLRSEMLEYEIETAYDQFTKTGKPVLLPVRVGGNDGLEGSAASILNPLHFFTWSGPNDDERLVAELVSAITEPPKQETDEAIRLEAVGGAVPPGSPFYVRRDCDGIMMQALDARETILLVKGARQIGKTSLLAQGTKHTRDSGFRVAVTDFQKFNNAQINSDESFYRLLAATFARQLKFNYDFAANWDPIFGANLNMENFLRDMLDARNEPLVWFMDEVDKLFTASFASDFFGLVRSWHNSRSTEPGGPWDKLTVVIAYATEAHLFIQDVNQSPFNVGRKIPLGDFNLQQTIDLNARYGGPLGSYAETETLFGLISGQPFLTRCALDALATKQETLSSLLKRATADEGPFNDHLKRMLISVTSLPEVTEYVRSVLAGTAIPQQDTYYRLLSAGIVQQDTEGRVVFRCELYRAYLERMMPSLD